MLEIAEAGVVGKTTLLLEMHRFRKRVFKDHLRWNLHETPGGLEVDDFDVPGTPYLIALDNNYTVVGCWRMTPTTSPTMIETLWPQFLATIGMPKNSRNWEVSRFAVDVVCDDPAERKRRSVKAIRELLQGLMEISLLCGIEHIFTMYDQRIAAMLNRLNYLPACTSAQLKIEGELCRVARFDATQAALSDLKQNFGTEQSLVSPEKLSPTLARFRNTQSLHKEEQYVES